MTPKQETSLLRLKKKYRDCERCDLYETRNKVVFGTGLCDRGVMILGEAPGPEEDKKGKPFIGRAGKMLDRFLRMARLKRNDTFIFNACLCFPGRDEFNKIKKPDELELIRCSPRLKKTIAILKPRLIVVLGGSALMALTSREGVGKNRGPGWFYQGPKVRYRIFVTYHPAGCLRNPEFKEKAIEDWKRIGRHLDGGRKRKKKRNKRPTKLC